MGRKTEVVPVFVWPPRLLSSNPLTPDLQDTTKEKDSNTLSAARLRALLSFYHESQVRLNCMFILYSACPLPCVCINQSVCVRVFPAASACGLPGGQSVGLCWCSTEELGIVHHSTSARPYCTGDKSVCVCVWKMSVCRN